MDGCFGGYSDQVSFEKKSGPGYMQLRLLLGSSILGKGKSCFRLNLSIKASFWSF